MPSPFSGIVDGDDLFASICGKYIGEGDSRIVYEHAGDPERVVKIGKMKPYISNLTEWIIWQQIAGNPKLNKLFGECFALSASGRYLIMENLGDAPSSARATTALPVWATDSKGSALGKSQSGGIKIRDYGHVSIGVTLAGPELQILQADPAMKKWTDIVASAEDGD